MSFEEDFLAHYGKKGMRWGQRKAPDQPIQNLRNKQGLTYKEYKRDPNFKKDVRSGVQTQVELRRTVNGPELQSTGKYRSAADKKAIGTDYANAVLKAQGRKRLMSIGIAVGAAVVGGKAIGII